MMILEVICVDFLCKNNGICVDIGILYICVCVLGIGRIVKIN